MLHSNALICLLSSCYLPVTRSELLFMLCLCLCPDMSKLFEPAFGERAIVRRRFYLTKEPLTQQMRTRRSSSRAEW